MAPDSAKDGMEKAFLVLGVPWGMVSFNTMDKGEGGFWYFLPIFVHSSTSEHFGQRFIGSNARPLTYVSNLGPKISCDSMYVLCLLEYNNAMKQKYICLNLDDETAGYLGKRARKTPSKNRATLEKSRYCCKRAQPP